MGSVIDERRAILERVAQYRNEGAIRKTDGIRWELSIPKADYAALIAANPALNSRDAKEKTASWHAFIASDASKIYRVRAYR